VFRILGGEKRGKKLNGPSGLEFRPTTGRVKSFVFSFFQQDIEGTAILDLFSGSGSFGLEAISRGALECVCVEKDDNAVRLLKANIHTCGFNDRIRVVQGDVFSVLEMFARQKKAFDFILADPPFKDSLREKIVIGVDQQGVLVPNGYLIVEHEWRDPDSMKHGLKLLKQKRFGHCMVSIYGYVDFSS
jgi:16S rRNA (guanine966-N2)-methyltransferase